MPHTTPLCVPLAALLLAATALGPGEEALRERDQQDLGRDIAAYYEAKQTNKGLGEALAGLDESLDKIKKKLKGKDPLSLTADLGRAMWFAQLYDKQKGIKKGRVDTNTATSPWTVEYAVHAPKRYDPKTAYPLLLCIPDEGETPSEDLIEKWADADLRESAIIAVVPMPADASLWSVRGDPGAPGGGGNVRIVYGDVIGTYAVDFDRVYLAGWGRGVAAATRIASESPDLFAGVVGRSGDVAEGMPHENFANLPTLFLSGGAGATDFSERITKAEYKNCTLVAEGGEPEILAWMKEHPRVSNPAHVVFVSSNRYVNKAYWLEVPAAEGERRIEATIDRETNTITVKGEGAESLTLYFNDELVDLDRPVKVVCNGVQHLDEIPRNVTTMLDLMWNRRSDPGKLYTARNVYDLSI
jgi:hypothetical protein